MKWIEFVSKREHLKLAITLLVLASPPIAYLNCSQFSSRGPAGTSDTQKGNGPENQSVESQRNSVSGTAMPILKGNVVFSQSTNNFATQYTYQESYDNDPIVNTGLMYYGNNFDNACNPNGKIPASVPPTPLGLPPPYDSNGNVDAYYGSIQKMNSTFPFGNYVTADGGAGFNLNTSDPNVPTDATCKIWNGKPEVMDQIIGIYPDYIIRPEFNFFNGSYSGIQVTFDMMVPYASLHQAVYGPDPSYVSVYGNFYFNFYNATTNQLFQMAAGGISFNPRGGHPAGVTSNSVNQDIGASSTVYGTNPFITSLIGTTPIVTAPGSTMMSYGFTISQQQAVNAINNINTYNNNYAKAHNIPPPPPLSTNISQYVVDYMWYDIEAYRQNYTNANPLQNDAVMMSVFLKNLTISQVQVQNNQPDQMTFNLIPASSPTSCLDVPTNNTLDGTVLDQAACSNAIQQSWSLNPVGNQQFQIVSNLSGSCLDIVNAAWTPGTPMQEYHCKPGDQAELWSFVPVGVNQYQIVSVMDQLCLQAPSANGQPWVQETCGSLGQGNQTFGLQGALNLDLRIKPLPSGSCVDLTNGSSQDGTPIQQWTCGANDMNQSWYMNALAPGQMQIVSHLTHKCLEVAGGSTANGALIQENDCKGISAKNQIWNMQTISPSAQYHIPAGAFHLVSANNTQECLDVPNGSGANGVQLQQWDCGTQAQTAQIFLFGSF